MHQPAVSDWLPRRRSLPLLPCSPHTLESPPTTWFLPSVLVFFTGFSSCTCPLNVGIPGSAPCLLVSLLSLDSHLPVHDSPDRWIWNFSPLDLSFELEINISNCPLDISAWMSQRYYKFTMSKLYFISFPWKMLFPYLSERHAHPNWCAGQKSGSFPWLSLYSSLPPANPISYQIQLTFLHLFFFFWFVTFSLLFWYIQKNRWSRHLSLMLWLKSISLVTNIQVTKYLSASQKALLKIPPYELYFCSFTRVVSVLTCICVCVCVCVTYIHVTYM